MEAQTAAAFLAQSLSTFAIEALLLQISTALLSTIGALANAAESTVLDRLQKAFAMNRTRESTISSFYTRIQIMYKTTAGRKPKKKIYHRVQELDRKTASLLLRDLEKEVGFVHKWTYMAVIERYPTIFRVFGGQGSPPAVTLTEKAKKIVFLESEARAVMEPILVRNLRKLLMLSVDCRLPLKTIDLISDKLGLPDDFKDCVILKYPVFFRLDEMNGREFLHLENWDSSLAVTAREERLSSQELIFNTKRFRRRD
ncbi:hypothetical protein SASPL_127511 [Salvia splendens]|uniref:PORR domain-containing protein n=1 Tax=Salvia splendens TaxID=180675 RepID=A0A8X8XD83_SALSN|nr:hypothetical protein SASPL_127511 [Salvia splendens]